MRRYELIIEVRIHNFVTPQGSNCPDYEFI